VREEPGSRAFRAEIEDWPTVVASALLEVEALRFAARLGYPEERVVARLAGVALVAIDDGIVSSAARVGPPGLRSLDAIHLVTALRLRQDLGAFFVYDERLAQAARVHGLDARSPGA